MSAASRFRAPLLLLGADLFVPLVIILMDFNGRFESFGAFSLLFLIIIGTIIHIFVIFQLTHIWYTFFTQEKSFGKAVSGVITFVLILLLTILLANTPSHLVKILAPIRDAYLENRVRNESEKLEPFYKEPTYFPPQVSPSSKKVTIYMDGRHPIIRVSYICDADNSRVPQPWDPNPILAVDVMPSNYDRSFRNQEIVKVGAEEGIFVGEGQLILYDSNVTRRIADIFRCSVPKEELVRMMESLRPLNFVAETADVVVSKPYTYFLTH